MTKAKEDTKRIKWITGTNQLWIGYKVYAIQNGVVDICAGGLSEEEDIKRAEKYFREKKITG